MSLKIVITEKPSVAMDIARVLGGFTRHDGYLEKSEMIISWAVGHLLELAMPQDYDPALEKWNIDALPILPERFQLKPKPATRGQLNILKTLINRKDVTGLINACDAGREGELIFRYIIQYLNCSKPHQRLWLSETTDTAVRNAFANLRPSSELENLAHAAIARSQADWIVGINATRGYTTKHREKLTVGRVQTPTLALIANRDKDIENFISQDYWEIEAEFDAGGDVYTAKWFEDKTTRFTARAEAEQIARKLTPKSPAEIIKVESKEKIEHPPQLFNLTDLQKEANKRYGFTAEQTLNIAQKLYEAHLLTYPRTDSRHLTTAMSATLPARLNALQGTEFGPVVSSITSSMPSSKRYIDDSKVTDHTAIIITDVPLSALSDNELKIYMMVARRMVGIFLPPAKMQQTTVITNCQGETFGSRGKVFLEKGWKILYKDIDNTPVLPALAEGQTVTLEKALIQDKQTQPPKRYDDATILSAMENAGRTIEDEAMREAMKGKGLGTPATRAAIIEKLISTGYIERQKKLLAATEKGKILIDIVSPGLKNPELTGEWEKKLLDIERGKFQPDQFMQEIKQFAQGIITEIKSQQPTTVSFTADKGIGPCPLCGRPVIENKKAYGCSGWREGCKFVIWKKIAGKKISQAQAKKIIEKGRSDLIKGFESKKGNKFDAYLRLESGEIKFDFPARICNN